MRHLFLAALIGCNGTKTTPLETDGAPDTAAASVPEIDTDTTPPTTDTGSLVVDLNPPELVLCAPEPALPPIENIPLHSSSCTLQPTDFPVGVTVFAEDIYLASMPGSSTGFGESMVALGDVDGDFYDDIAVGSPGYEYGGAGTVYIYSGAELQGLATPTTVLAEIVEYTDDPLFFGYQANRGFGQTLSVGDPNRDGVPDLLTSGSGERTVHFFPLPLDEGEVNAATATAGGVSSNGSTETRGFAWGDINGDGQLDLSLSGTVSVFDDSAIRSCGVSVHTEPLAPDGGVVTATPYTWYGTFYEGTDWATYEASALDIPPTPWSEPGCSGSRSPALIHDTTGDGFADVLLGGDRMIDIATPLQSEESNHGGFVLFDGGTPGAHAAEDARAVLYGECGADLGGNATAVGDITGDCRPDVLVAGNSFAFPGELQVGAVFVLSELHRTHGEVPLAEAAGAIIYGEDPSESKYYLGLESSPMMITGSLGDLNQDGHEDLIVGARSPLSDEGGFSGTAYIFLGPVSGIRPALSADLIIRGPRQSRLSVVGAAGDVNNDGILDVMMGGSDTTYILSGATLLDLLP